MKYIDDLLNKITMYRLAVYGLAVIAGAALLMAAMGRLSMSPSRMVLSGAVILLGCYVSNWLLARIWDVPTNSESWLITGLILFLILQPATHLYQYLALVLAAVIATASKFVIAWRGKHIFNPAALAATIMGLVALTTTSWWVGSTALWPVTLFVGLAIVRKIRRFPMVVTFVLVATSVQLFIGLLGGHGQTLHSLLLSSPLIFLSTIMLTEPATMPPRRNQQILFAALIGVLYATSLNIGSFYIYPEVALLIGNLYAYAVSPKFRLELQLREVQKISERVYSYVFQPDRSLNFLPGQYMELTAAGVPYDSRGNRRTFTIASSPTESDMRFGLKYYEPSSAFKETFGRLVPGDVIYASQLAGNFTLPGKESRKMVFIAGGIGITPFRSMVKYLTDTNQACDITLIYLVSDPAELAYEAEFRAAAPHGLRFIPISPVAGPKNNTYVGELNAAALAKIVPDYAERLFYISGPHPMVETAKGYLRSLAVPSRHIKTDHFSGY